MSHLDEGQLHALLDGELDEEGRRAAQAHLNECAECRREFAEARALMTGADDLIASVQVPPGAERPVAPPVRRPGFNWKAVAWAASVTLAVGLGWLSRADYQRSVSSAPDSGDAGGLAAVPPSDSMLAKANGGPVGIELRRDESPRIEGRLKVPAPAPAAPPASSPAPVKQAEPVTATDAVRALTNPADKDLGDARQNLAVGEAATAEQKAAKIEAAEEKPAPIADQPLPAAKSALQETGGRGFAPAAPVPARRERAVAAFRPTRLEEAVRILGGSIRLVDGMTPTGVLVGAGALVTGADPSLEVVRVVYEDPPGRELWLDQQRPRETMNELDAPGKTATTLLPGDTLVVTSPGGQRGLRWVHQTGFRLELTGFLPADSLRALARRVQ